MGGLLFFQAGTRGLVTLGNQAGMLVACLLRCWFVSCVGGCGVVLLELCVYVFF